MREASTGLDENTAQPNVILYIILAVAILVVLGGAGIFY
jgi:preprotein translocase subunit Sec61beta